MNAGDRGGEDGDERRSLADLVELRDHDPAWALMFREERDLLAEALGDLVISVEHIGSTAVPGLRAKPIIDILVGVEELSLELFASRLERIGYVHVPIEEEGRLFFRKGMPRTHHLHLVREGSEEQMRHLRFRDRLIQHPEEAEEYQRLKERLAIRFHKDREAYTEGMNAFIQDMLARDRDGR